MSHTPPLTNSPRISQRIRISGMVQGVGFRPFVWRLAKELKLTGWVRNDAQGIEIEACGPKAAIERLIERLGADAPSTARIDSLTSRHTASVSVTDDFFILDSRGGRSATMIGPDMAVCRDCLGDIFDREGRRWRYAFNNCNHCGPRYSICKGLPYDRERTSFAAFAMCKRCDAEYHRPDDRRLHAEANCCPKCGPKLTLLDAYGNPLDDDPVAGALRLLQAGQIVAIKSMSGFHLACDARNPAAVAALRERKGRETRPFPVMVANAPSASALVQVSVGEPGLLNLPERPIILLKKRGSCDKSLAGVAPGLAWLGVMLPHSPIHYLLFHEAAGQPDGLHWLEKAQDLALVMTSANPADEPVAIDNDEALRRLAGIADAFLVHDREIVTRSEDSIACSGPGGLQLVRRGRGYAPRAIKLPHAGPPILAVGGVFKNAVCVTRGDEAFVSQHIGDLSNPAACGFFEETITQLLKTLEVGPALIAHDLQQDIHSTRFALDFARQRGIPSLAVQHHHAHIAAVLAEHRINDPVVSLALDGVGTGSDGGPWGGELLRVDGDSFTRLGHLEPLPMAGNDALSRTPWALGAAVLNRLGRADEITRRFAAEPQAEAIAARLAAGSDLPTTSSLGRLLDAAAALLNVNRVMGFEGQPGLLLEGMAEHFGEAAPLHRGWRIENGRLDFLPLLAVLAEETKVERGAAILHATLIAALTEWVCQFAPKGSTVAAGGGCLLNQVLARGLRAKLAEHDLHLIEARRIPPNDGGIALGQAWVALQYLNT